MTPEQEEARNARLEAARAKRAKAARKRMIAFEGKLLAAVRSASHIDPEDVRKFEYIGKQMTACNREDEDLRTLRSTRDRLMRAYGLEIA